MTFAYEPVLLLLLLLPVMAIFLWRRARQRRAALRQIGDEDLVRYLSSQVSPTRRATKAALWLLAAGFIIVALARPVWGIEAQTIEAEGVSIMVVLDVSRSMDAQDVSPTRLKRAQLDLNDFFRAVAGNELGLILYAQRAFIQFPLTSDVDSALVFLNAANTQSVTSQGTNIENALRLAISGFDERIAAQSVIVLVSDGENHEGDPLTVAQMAAEQGIIIHAIGYGGTEGAPIPILNFAGNIEYKADSAGNVVLTRLEESTLQTIANITGGLYLRADSPEFAVDTLASQINSLNGGVLGSRTVNRGVERFGIFVALALLCLSLEMMLSETNRKAA